MALATPTQLDTKTSTAAATSLASNSITPTAGSLLLVGCALISGSAATQTFTMSTTLTGQGSWTVIQVGQGGTSSKTWCMLAYSICGASPGTGTVTVSWTNSTNRITVITDQITGQDPTTPVAQNNTNSGTATTLTVTLTNTPASNSATFGFVTSNATSNTVAPGSNYTELSEATAGATADADLESEYKLGGQLTAVDWSGLGTTGNAGIAIEINCAPDILFPILIPKVAQLPVYRM